MTTLIHRIFGHSDALVCGRCEKPLEGHSEADCARKMSRRWFLGATLGAVAGAVVAPSAVQAFTQADVIKTFEMVTQSAARDLYRIPIRLYRGGNFHKYKPDGDDLGYDSYRYAIMSNPEPVPATAAAITGESADDEADYEDDDY